MPHNISIHPPRAGRDFSSHAAISSASISIHPPRAGRDGKTVFLTREEAEFQSTRPVRGGTPSQPPLMRTA